MDVLIAAFGYPTIYALVWRRIFKHHRCKGRGLFVAHLLGFLIGWLPPFFYIGTVALASTTEDGGPKIGGAITFGILFVVSMLIIYRLAPRPPSTGSREKIDVNMRQVWADISSSFPKQKVAVKQVRPSTFRPKVFESTFIASGSQTFQFKYRDEQGRKSTRTVDVDWAGDDCFRGYCHLRSDERTFRFDRVQGDVIHLDSGEVLAVDDWRESLN